MKAKTHTAMQITTVVEERYINELLSVVYLISKTKCVGSVQSYTICSFGQLFLFCGATAPLESRAPHFLRF